MMRVSEQGATPHPSVRGSSGWRRSDVAKALSGGGLSTGAGLNGLSLGAVRLYLATDVGNCFDVHLLTGIGSRRYMLKERHQR